MSKSQTVLITGSSSGIGFELAKIFADNNYNLVLIAKDKEKLLHAAEKLKRDNISLWFIAKDLSDPKTPNAIYDELQDQGIVIDVLVNNAGFATYGLFTETDLQAEDKYRKRKVGDPVYHVYYHCSRQKKYDCAEPYMTEEKLVKQILRYINFMYMAHPQLFTLNNFIKASMETYKKTRDEILWAQDINPSNKPLEIMDYASYIFRNGTIHEKREVTNILSRQLYIHNETVTSVPLL